MEAFAGLYVLVVLLLIVLAICWIVLPFAILGTKPLLRDILAEAKRNGRIDVPGGPAALRIAFTSATALHLRSARRFADDAD